MSFWRDDTWYFFYLYIALSLSFKLPTFSEILYRTSSSYRILIKILLPLSYKHLFLYTKQIMMSTWPWIISCAVNKKTYLISSTKIDSVIQICTSKLLGQNRKSEKIGYDHLSRSDFDSRLLSYDSRQCNAHASDNQLERIVEQAQIKTASRVHIIRSEKLSDRSWWKLAIKKS